MPAVSIPHTTRTRFGFIPYAALLAWVLGIALFAPWHCVHAQAPATQGPTWVLISFPDKGWPEGLSERVLEDLRAGLLLSGIEVHTTPQGKNLPLATVAYESFDEAEMSSTINILDAVTAKVVRRTIDLRGLDPDTLSFTIAVATEELLRASWAELDLETRTPRPPPPAEVTTFVDRARPPQPDAIRFEATMWGHVDIYQDGTTLVGPEGLFGVGLSRWLQLDVSVGYRHLLARDNTRGTTQGSAWLLGAGVTVPLFDPSAEWGVNLSTHTRAQLLTLEGTASRPGVLTAAATQGTVTMVLSATAIWRFVPNGSVRLGAGIGATPLGVVILSQDTEVLGIEGVLGHACLGVSFDW